MVRSRFAAPVARRPVVVLLVLASLVGATVLAIDAGGEPRSVARPQPVEASVGELRTLYCPVAFAEDESAVVSVAAVGEQDSETVVDVFRDGVGEQAAAATLAPGESEAVALDEPSGVAVRARGGEIAATWTVEGELTASAPCAEGPAPTWYLAGLDTSLGSQAQLHLFNPFSVDAVVRVSYGTAEGGADLVRTENVAVEAGASASLDLRELQPEEPDLGVRVETLAGRVIAQGEVERTPIDEEDEQAVGRALVPAAAAPSRNAYFAYGADGNDWSSSLAVYNPGDREASVRVQAADPSPDSPVEETSVPPGGVARIDMSGRAQEVTFAAVLESVNDVPVVVSRLEGNRGDRTGLALVLAAGRPSTRWVTAGAPGERDNRMSVHNPGPLPSTVDVVVAGQPLEGWQQRVLEPNERAWVDLADGADGQWPVVVEADEPVTAEAVSSLAEGEDLGRAIGLTSTAGSGASAVAVPPAQFEQALRLRPVVFSEGEG